MIYEPLEDAQLFLEAEPSEPTPAEPETVPIEPEDPDIHDLRERIDLFMSRRELAPHRLAHFVAAAYQEMGNALDPFRRLSELRIDVCRNPEDDSVAALDISFFEFRTRLTIRVVERGDLAEVSMGCEEEETFTPLTTTLLRFGLGEWAENVGRLTYRYLYHWLSRILD